MFVFSRSIFLLPAAREAAWGYEMRTYHATKKEEDPSAEYLSYYTDNGAAHYYNPLPYTNFHDALLSVYNYSVDHNLPIRYSKD